MSSGLGAGVVAAIVIVLIAVILVVVVVVIIVGFILYKNKGKLEDVGDLELCWFVLCCEKLVL